MSMLSLITKNKYLIVIAVFTLWIVFLDPNNVFEISKRKRMLDSIADKKEIYLQNIKRDSLILNELNSDDKKIEEFARKKFFYHKNDEVVFKIIYQNKKQ